STGQGQETNLQLEGFLIKGTSNANSISVLGGQVGFAVLGDDLGNLNILFVDGGAAVRCGVGTTFTSGGTTVVEVNSGSLILNSAVTETTATKGVILNGGTLTIFGTGAYGVLNVWVGTVNHFSTGTITTLNVGTSGDMEISPDISLTITNTNCYGNGTLRFNAHTVT